VIYSKTPEEIEKIRAAGKILVQILDDLSGMVAPGIRTIELEERAQELLRENSVTSPFQGYEGYRHATCISVNEVVVHGVPGELVIGDGDIVGIDFGVTLDGWNADSARSVIAGQASPEDQKLLDVTQQALTEGIKKAVIGNHIGDIGAKVQAIVESAGFSVVRSLAGHGIGRSLHEAPEVPNFGHPGEGEELKEGMVICIEPMVNAGGYEVVADYGEWPVRTADVSRAVHFEHTIAITKNGPDILTN
jgi:methionyl aminopeptidase